MGKTESYNNVKASVIVGTCHAADLQETSHRRSAPSGPISIKPPDLAKPGAWP